jgi:hypothetical protein
MSTAHSPSRHRHPLSPAQQELREAVKRSAERRRPPPNLSVRISPSPQASERDREPALSSTYGRLSERMADRSTPRWLGRQSLSSAMAQATASELEKIRVEEGIMHRVGQVPMLALSLLPMGCLVLDRHVMCDEGYSLCDGRRGSRRDE